MTSLEKNKLALFKVAFIFCFNSFIYLCKKIKRHESESQETMDEMQRIYNAIAHDGFADTTLQIINDYVNDILYGRKNLSRFTIEEHAGLCTAGEVLIGASIIASYATRSLTASCHAEGGQGSPANWQIDECQEQLIEQWAKASKLWVEDALVNAKGFRDNWDGQGVNYISDRMALEDMHPANVFVDEVSGKPICIDCIVKFV